MAQHIPDGAGVPVYIRDYNSEKPVGMFLGRFALNELDEVIKSLANWGCIMSDGEFAEDRTGQFFVDDDATGFEIVVEGRSSSGE